jgi:hypothetical protein
LKINSRFELTQDERLKLWIFYFIS